MKKQLTVTGKVSLSRVEIINIIDKHLRENESLIVTKAIFPCQVDEVILEVKGASCDDDVSDKYDRPLLKSQGGKNFTRPNYGIGKFIKTQLFKPGQRKEFNEIYSLVHSKFSNMSPELTRQYLAKYKIKQVEVGIYSK